MKSPYLPRRRDGSGKPAYAPKYEPPPHEVGWKGSTNRQCSYKNKLTGRCMYDALPGLRRCGEHRAAAGGRPATVGTYTAFFANRALRSRWKMHRQNPELVDARDEIAAVRTIIERSISTANMQDQEVLMGLVKQLDYATRMQERYINMVQIRAGSWSLQEVRQFGLLFANAINSIVKDAFERRALLENLVIALGNDENGPIILEVPAVIEGMKVG